MSLDDAIIGLCVIGAIGFFIVSITLAVFLFVKTSYYLTLEKVESKKLHDDKIRKVVIVKDETE